MSNTSGSKPFEKPAYEPQELDEWVETFLNCESVLQGHFYAICEPNPDPPIDRIAVLSQLVRELTLSDALFDQYAEEVSEHGIEFYGFDGRGELLEQVQGWGGFQLGTQYSERQPIIKNPETAKGRAGQIWTWAIVGLFRLRAGKHWTLKMEDVDEQLRRRIDRLLEGVNEDSFKDLFDPRREGTRKWGH